MSLKLLQWRLAIDDLSSHPIDRNLGMIACLMNAGNRSLIAGQRWQVGCNSEFAEETDWRQEFAPDKVRKKLVVLVGEVEPPFRLFDYLIAEIGVALSCDPPGLAFGGCH